MESKEIVFSDSKMSNRFWSVLLESLNPGDRFRFCFESNNCIYVRGQQVGELIEVKQVTPTAGTPEVFHRNTLVIKL